MTLMATMLAGMPELRLRVQAQHIPDRYGHCAECRNNIRWPCEVYHIAADAEQRGARSMPWTPPTQNHGQFF